MDTDEGLQRFRVAQRSFAAEEVRIRSEGYATAASRRVAGLVQQSNAVHRGQRPEEENVQIVHRFYHVVPPPLIFVENDVEPRVRNKAMPILSHYSAFNADDIYEGFSNPTQEQEIGIHEGIAAKYRARKDPGVINVVAPTKFEPPPDKPTPAPVEKNLIDIEKKSDLTSDSRYTRILDGSDAPTQSSFSTSGTFADLSGRPDQFSPRPPGVPPPATPATPAQASSSNAAAATPAAGPTASSPGVSPVLPAGSPVQELKSPVSERVPMGDVLLPDNEDQMRRIRQLPRGYQGDPDGNGHEEVLLAQYLVRLAYIPRINAATGAERRRLIGEMTQATFDARLDARKHFDDAQRLRRLAAPPGHAAAVPVPLSAAEKLAAAQARIDQAFSPGQNTTASQNSQSEESPPGGAVVLPANATPGGALQLQPPRQPVFESSSGLSALARGAQSGVQQQQQSFENANVSGLSTSLGTTASPPPGYLGSPLSLQGSPGSPPVGRQLQLGDAPHPGPRMPERPGERAAIMARLDQFTNPDYYGMKYSQQYSAAEPDIEVLRNALLDAISKGTKIAYSDDAAVGLSELAGAPGLEGVPPPLPPRRRPVQPPPGPSNAAAAPAAAEPAAPLPPAVRPSAGIGPRIGPRAAADVPGTGSSIERGAFGLKVPLGIFTAGPPARKLFLYSDGTIRPSKVDGSAAVPVDSLKGLRVGYADGDGGPGKSGRVVDGRDGMFRYLSTRRTVLERANPGEMRSLMEDLVARYNQNLIGRASDAVNTSGSGKPAKRGRFEKGSAEAKAFMSELRAKRKKV